MINEKPLQPDPIEEAFEAVPEEVQDFMTGPAFDILIEAGKKVLELSDTQKELLEIGALRMLLKLETMDTLAVQWKEKGTHDELIVKMLYFIHQEILMRAQEIVEYTNLPTIDEAAGIEKAPSPQTALANIQERLRGASIVQPSKRDYSIERTSAPSKPADPYREMPE